MWLWRMLQQASQQDPANQPAADDDMLYQSRFAFNAETISAATAAVIIYMIPNLYIQYAEFSLSMQISRIWGEGSEHHAEGRRALHFSMISNCVAGTVLYLGTTVVVRILSTPMDNRANAIVVGLSQLFSGCVFLLMSIMIPQWFGVYHSNKRRVVSYTSSREISMNLSLHLWKQLISMYFFDMYFSCADNGFSVLWGALIGIFAGFFLLYITSLARKPQMRNHKFKIAIVVVVFLAAVSLWVIMVGVNYICEVWMPDNHEEKTIALVTVGVVWFAAIVAVHVGLDCWTKKKKTRGHSMRFNSRLFDVNEVLPVLAGGGSKTEEMTVFQKGEDDNGVSESVGDNAGGDNEDKQAEGTGEGRVKFAMSEEQIEKENERGQRERLRSERLHGVYHGPEDAPPFRELILNKLADTYPCLCFCLKKKYSFDNISKRRLDFVTEARPKSTGAKIGLVVKRFIWYLLSLWFFFQTIVNIGATQQQTAARNALEPAFQILYPSDYNNGTMCAWDKAGPNATIRTFDTPQSVYDANFTIVHCGACGACSNWNDLTLQYTTVEVLAGIGKWCTKGSIFKPHEWLIQCYEDRVGFTRPCSEAWAWDSKNTKQNAIFVAIQAFFSNAFSDMAVGFADITMATVDEAMSGPRFVPWVGATRRRMAIVSDIKRPLSQQCTTVKQNWTKIFPDPFRPPVGGTYNVMRPNGTSFVAVIEGRDSQ